MKICVNGEEMTVSEPLNLDQLIEVLDITHEKIATEVNGLIVPHSTYNEYALTEGDRLEIVRAVGGGQI